MKYEQTQKAIEQNLRGLQDAQEITEDEYGSISGALSGVQPDLRSQPPQKGDGPVDNQTIETVGPSSKIGEGIPGDDFETSEGPDVEIHLRSDRKEAPATEPPPELEEQFPMVLDDMDPEWSTAIYDMSQDPEFVKTIGLGKFGKFFRKKRPPRKPFNVHPMGNASENDQFLRKIVEKHMVEKMEFTESRSIDEILEEAKADPRDPRKMDPKAFDNSAMVAKMRMYTLASARKLIKTMQKMDADPTPVNIKAWKDANVDLWNHMRHEQEIKAGPARTTRIMAERLEELDDPISEMVAGNFADKYIDRVMRLPEGYNAQQAVKIMLQDVKQDMADEEVLRWAEKAKDIIGWNDLFLATMYPFMLSSFKTILGANFLSNANILVNYPLTKMAAAGMSPIRRALPKFKNDQDRIIFTEGMQSLMVVKRALPEAIQFAWQTMKTNQPAGGQKTKLDQSVHADKGEGVFTSENLRAFFENIHQNPANKDKWFQKTITPQTVKEGGSFAKLIDSWGKFWSYTDRGLKGGDEFFKVFGRRLGQLHQAHRYAWRDLQARAITEGEFDRAVDNYLDAPTKKMVDEGEILAEFLTLQTKLGKLGELAEQYRDAATFGLPWGRIMIPFLKVMVNSTKYTLHMANLTGNSFDDLKGVNGGAAQDMALGRFVVAGGYVTTAGLLATNFWPGITLFGYGASGKDMPDPENQRALREIEQNAGFKPCSLMFTDKDGSRHAYQFNKIEPLGTYFCTVADIARNFDDIQGYWGQEEYGKLMMTAYAVGHNNLISKSWAQSVHQLMDLAMNPNDGSARYFDNLVTRVIPRVVADFKTTAGDNEYREAQHSIDGFVGMWEQIKKQIPGLSKTLPGKRNIWHEPVSNHGQWGPDQISPFKYTGTKPDMVDDEMYRLQVPMRNVPYRVEGIKLHPRVRLRWIELANAPQWTDNLNLSGGKSVTAKQAVKMLIQSTVYQDATEEERVTYIKREISQRRGYARQILFEPVGFAQIDEVIAKYQPDLITDIAEAKALGKQVEHPIEESQAYREGRMAAPSKILKNLQVK